MQQLGDTTTGDLEGQQLKGHLTKDPVFHDFFSALTKAIGEDVNEFLSKGISWGNAK